MSYHTVADLFIPCRLGSLMVAASLMLALAPASAKDSDHSNAYVQSNLVSDLAGIAQIQDTNLVNPWGISFSASSPFWISDNGSGLSTLYAVTNDSGSSPHVVTQGLKVSIPGDGVPTGQLFDGVGSFNGDNFIFAGEDGTISGWRGALGTSAELLVLRTTAVYKGITLITNTGTPLLLLANFAEGTVDAYDTNLDLVQFSDPHAPPGYAPFNVQSIHGFVFVTFAKQDDAKHDDVAGNGNGLIDVFNPHTGRFHRFATGSDAGGHLKAINSPWGVALAPGSFGGAGDRLLVGNFGSGTIMTFDANGDFGGLLEDTHHQPIAIDGLWGLAFGNDGRAGVSQTLYFTAGLNGEADGLFGSIVPAPAKKHQDDD
ncbi:MAG TPA: TIGR03118 family protein [Candidatus Acidoferrales bacterium]|nr:TIGR03118 family protein [Candidatus Acidoferrales bacterium]